MEKIIRGKCLVRKSKLKDGKPVLTITGIFHPINFEMNEVNDDDEMWVANMIVSNGLRFTEPNGVDGGSPEDFLVGEMAHPSCWKKKSKL